ncbi:hypothetical protein C0J45_23246, partial [Silurus meridionalis]
VLALLCKSLNTVLFSMTGDSMADSIEPLFTHKAVDEGDDVTLSCNYKTTDPNTILYWYKQHPKSKPVFLLYIHESTKFKSNIPPRLDVEVDKNNKQVDLIIFSAAVSDSALYYCALVPTVTGNPAVHSFCYKESSHLHVIRKDPFLS